MYTKIMNFALLLIICQTAVFAQWSGDPAVNTVISRSSYQDWAPKVISDGSDGAIVVWKYFRGGNYGYDIVAQRIAAGGELAWSATVDVCSATKNQESYQVTTDGDGGAMIVWEDQRNSGASPEYDIFAQRVDKNGNIQWQVDGIPICTASDVQSLPKIASDGAGGAFIVWHDSRNYSTNFRDIYAQRVNASGNTLWSTNGVPVCALPSEQSNPDVIPDGSGGVIVGWLDDRNAGYKIDVYAQRLDASGAKQWTANGVGYVAQGNQLEMQLASDNSGGVFIVWSEDFNGVNDWDIRMVRITAAGNIAWTPGNVWICGANGNQMSPRIVSDGQGNAIIAWEDFRNGSANPDIYAQRVNASGQISWNSWGKSVCNAAGKQLFLDMSADQFGGALLTWHDDRSGNVNIYAQRIEASGTLAWQNNGAAICTALKPQQKPAITLSGTCGAIIAWEDQRWVGDPQNDTDWDIYAQRIRCDGTLPGGSPGESITVDVPNGNEDWTVGTTHYIVWHTQNYSAPVQISYSTNGGTNYNIIENSYTGAPSYAWTIPNTPSNQCVVKVMDPTDSQPFDISDAVFTISAGSQTNTPVGTNIFVSLGDGVEIQFDNVTTAGFTKKDILTSGPPAPQGWALTPYLSPVYYDITTTAGYSGNIHISFDYTDSDYEAGKELELCVKVYDPGTGQWHDVTSGIDSNNNTVQASTDHLSLFAIMYPAGGAPGGVWVVNNTRDSGAGSLRDAMQQANSSAGPDTIVFNIPKSDPGHDSDVGVWFISPQSALPQISGNAVTIDGLSQSQFIGENTNPNGPEIQLVGTDAGENADGFYFSACEFDVRCLAIVDFHQNGIFATRTPGGRILGCYLGVAFDGWSEAGNGAGIYLYDSVQNVQIAPLDTMPNLISGNSNGGIVLQDCTAFNQIIGNFIGLGKDGKGMIGNAEGSGIYLSDNCENNEMFDNRIGGNVAGILINDGSNNTIGNNFIGSDPELMVEFGNQNEGVYILGDSEGNAILENVIAFNGGNGIKVEGTAAQFNRISRNRITQNTLAGILLANGGNSGIAAPVLSEITPQRIAGTAVANADVEIFEDFEDEGAYYIGAVKAAADGNFSFEGTIDVQANYTATATDENGNTSEFSSMATSVETAGDVPFQFELLQNYPNPFNPATQIPFRIARKSEVEISIYSITGQLVDRKLLGEKAPGQYEMTWESTDKFGNRLPSGVYFYQLKAGHFIECRKLVLFR